MNGLLWSPRSWLGVLVNVGAWVVWGTVVGYVGHRLGAARLARDTWLTRARRFEHGGRWYEKRLRIRRWKDRLPEAGAFFAGGVSKRRLGGRDAERLRLFVAETRRAELTHWGTASIAPAFALWNLPWATAVICTYAAVANLPGIAVQRYNRLRLCRVLAAAQMRPTGGVGSESHCAPPEVTGARSPRR